MPNGFAHLSCTKVFVSGLFSFPSERILEEFLEVATLRLTYRNLLLLHQA